MHVLRVIPFLSVGLALAADFRPPAGDRYVSAGSAGAILPGGRIIRPLGTQLNAGARPRALAVSRNGTIATADTGTQQAGITVIEPPGKGPWRERHIFAAPLFAAPEGAKTADKGAGVWRNVAKGIAFDESGKGVWVSEGLSGRIREIDQTSGDTRKNISLNGAEFPPGSTGELIADNARHLLFAVDATNSRVAVVDVKAGRVVSSVKTDPGPSAMALSPDQLRLYVATAESVCAIDVGEPLKPGVPECIRADSPGGVTANADWIFVSNTNSDAITVISAKTFRVAAEIPLRIPSFEKLRGIAPAGMAFDPLTKWLLVAESGINAIGIVDTDKNQVIGHLPVGWMPTGVTLVGDPVYVTNELGRGAGPKLRRPRFEFGEAPGIGHGTVSTFIMPTASELRGHTGTVFANNGFLPWDNDPPKRQAAIKHVVLIVKEDRTFDEVLGDVAAAGNGQVQSSARLALFGMHGLAIGAKTQFSVQDAAVTPNHHAIARQWSFSDNFHAEGYPDAARLSEHLKAANTTFRIFDNKDATSDQKRADEVIAALEEPLPQLILIHLPNDRLAEARPSEGYPYEASWMEDNDLALGRIVEALSHSRWWRETAVFIAESGTGGATASATASGAEDALDHIDSHRAILLAAGPNVKRDYVSHTNSDFSGLLRTIFELLHVPPMSLADATAATLHGMLTEQADSGTFRAIAPDTRIFEPGK
jgi:DNA-binding beta-propeller fold protein YncE